MTLWRALEAAMQEQAGPVGLVAMAAMAVTVLVSGVLVASTLAIPVAVVAHRSTRLLVALATNLSRTTRPSSM